MIKAKCKESSCCSSLILLCQFNAQVAIGGSVPKKPGDCNRNHIPKVLGPPKAPVTLRPDSSVERKEKNGGNREGMQRTAKLLTFDSQLPR